MLLMFVMLVILVMLVMMIMLVMFVMLVMLVTFVMLVMSGFLTQVRRVLPVLGSRSRNQGTREPGNQAGNQEPLASRNPSETGATGSTPLVR